MSSQIVRNPITALRIAMEFLTRIPVGEIKERHRRPLAESVWMFPVVGALVGLIGGSAYYFSNILGLPPLISAAITVGALYVTTGGLHEDGLADVADGFGGGNDRQQKLTIMRDSRTGTYGVAAIFFSMALRVLAIANLSDVSMVITALFVSGALSRASIGLVMAVLRVARPDGLSVMAGRPGAGQAFAALGIALVSAIVLLGIVHGVGITAITVVTIFFLAVLAKKQIGGQTGDVLGMIAQCVEVVVLLAISAR